MELFTDNDDLIAQICELLTGCGCCARCTLRYLGVKDMYTYRGETEEMNCLVKTLKSKRMEVDDKTECIADQISDKTVSDKESNENLAETKQPSGSVTNGDTDILCDGANAKTNEMLVDEKTDCATNEENTNTEVKSEKLSDSANLSVDENADCATNEGSTNTEVKSEKLSDDANTSDQSDRRTQRLVIKSTCIVCFGVLEEFTAPAFLHQIKSEVVDKGFVFSTYFCSLMLPVCVILREQALMLYLKEKFGDVYGGKKYTDVATVKDVWKWKNGPVLKEILGAPFDTKSPFEIILTFNYKDSDKECNFLFSSGLEIFRQRKMDRRHRNKKKSSFAVFTRANVATAVEKMSEDQFKKSYQCPPCSPSCNTVCDIKCQNEAVFVAGRYNKYSRFLSQTPWMIEGVRKSESSVEEQLCQEINKNFKPTEVKFSSSGREDVDVLMLGNGRPFVLELINPCRRDFPQEELNEMQKLLNSATKDIQCRDFQIVTREDVDKLKEGEIDKIKQYRAKCWTTEPVTDDKLNSLADMKDLTILQKTPIRVLHRRPLSTRDKIIHSMTVQRIDKHHFSIDMATQAGTYIKEFVHGDLGRTRPNLSTLLEVDCDIQELDVTAVELDWPKKICVPDEVT